VSGFDASAARSRCSPWALSSYTTQADSLLDELLEELEQSLEEEGAEEYPYWGTRPPLLPRRSSARGGLLLGLASAAALVAGLAFWMTLRPQLVVSYRRGIPATRGLSLSILLPCQPKSSPWLRRMKTLPSCLNRFRLKSQEGRSQRRPRQG
jgi:hypothetical protein